MTDESLFIAALEKTNPEERRAFLDAACAGDAAQRQRLDDLLAANNLSTGILDLSADVPEAKERTGPQFDKPGVVLAERYKLLEEIGQGGMGTVWVAEQIQPVRRKVAVKLVKAGMDSKNILARFEAERQALAVMDHPHIAKVLDGGTTDAGRPFFVMEYVKGVPITEYCDQARLNITERLALFVPVCQAVQHAHQKGIIHRDLKPSNILVCLYDGQPVPKVIDFGLAKAMHQPLTEHTLHTAHGLMLGTPLYMSPEQAEFNNLDVDTRTDVYALGVILYELLTGTTPLERDQLRKAAWDEMLRLIREEEPPRPSNRLSSSGSLPSVAAQRQLEPVRLTRLVRGELDWIVMKCLEKNRGRRYDTANGLAQDVQRYLANEPVEACPPSTSYRLRKAAHKYRVALAMTATISLLLVVVVIVSTWNTVRATRAEARAEEERLIALVAEGKAQEQRDQAVAEKKRADAERAVAQAVLDFLQTDLLGQADIENQPGGAGANREPNLTVRAALDRAALAITGKFASQPHTEAAVRLTIAQGYKALGRFAEARTHAERCIELHKKHHGPDHPDTLTAQDTLASVLQELGKTEQAEALFQQVLERRRTTLGPDHPDTLASLNHLAFSYMDRGMPLRGMPFLQEVIRKQTAIHGPNHPATLSSRANLAWLNFISTTNGRSTAEILEVIEAYRTAHGPDHPGLLDAQNILGLMYVLLGKHAESESTFRTLLAKRITLQGPTHIATLTCKKELAGALIRSRQLEAGIRMLEEVLGESRSQFGKSHPLTSYTLNELAEVYETEQPAKAMTLYEEVLANRRAESGPGSVGTVEPMRKLAMIQLKLGQSGKALTLMAEFVTLQRARMGADNIYFANVLTSLSNELLRYREYEATETYVRESLAIYRTKPSSWYVPFAKSLLGGALLGQAKYVDAEPMLLSAYEELKRVEQTIPSMNRKSLPETADRLVELYTALKKPTEAAKWRDERAKYPPATPPGKK